VPDVTAAFSTFQPRHAFFVGIDSDGCIFDTMELKHKECFAPAAIRFFGLQAVSKYARECWEFVNLYSKDRGVNRWPALVKVLDLLRERPEVKARGATIPEVRAIRDFIASGVPLDNANLRKRIEQTGDATLRHALEWSLAVNAAIADMVKNVPPFPFVRESLARLVERADVIVVSQTPTEALLREWQEHDLARYAAMICGQELGTKAEHIRLAAAGRYAPNRMLMIGDAPGDLKAARANNALFYPINPGREEASWERFHEEAIDRFFSGRFTADYERERINEFDAHLPEKPPWEH
jgi:phosphoglycolate phosphatase-like HAD superfamily hydrolase